MREILKGEDPQLAAIIAIIDHAAPDVLVLTDFDYDANNAALTAFSNALPAPFPYVFSAPPNAGVQRGLDLDGDGFFGDARDALGYGRFRGDGALAVLSRYPFAVEGFVDHTALLWRDVPGAVLPQMDGDLWPSDDVFDVLPVSSTNHWMLPVQVGDTRLTLLTLSATPPVFDGPEDFNGLRNEDELRLFEATLDGRLGQSPENPVLVGNLNADPFDGDGRRDVLSSLLNHGQLQDPQPASVGATQAADPSHRGNPAFDTADWPDGVPGNLRVSYVLPAATLTVIGAGVFWPSSQEPDAALLGSDGLAAGSHRLVWVDVAW